MKKKNIFLNIILPLISLIFTLSSLELFCRLYLQPHANDKFVQPHEKLGKFFIPGKKGWYVQKTFVQQIEINSKGLRDREYSYEKNDKTFRILLLSDSFGAAFQVPLKDTFHSILEDKINSGDGEYNVEVINGSYPGWGTGKELEFYKYEGQKYSPDLVILAFLIVNDVLDNYYWENGKYQKEALSQKEDSQVKRKTSSLEKVKYWLTDNIRLYTYINRRVKEGAPKQVLQFLSKVRLLGERPYSKNYIPADYFIYAKKEIPEITQGWQITKRLVLRLKSEVEKNNTRFAVVILTDREKIHNDIWEETLKTYPKMNELQWDLDKPRRILINFLEREEIQYLDLSPYFMEYANETGKYLHYRYDGHWNISGHHLAGETIYKWLMSQNIIP